jgi:hypothetical protein
MRTGTYLQHAQPLHEGYETRAVESIGGLGILLFMALHVPLALIMRRIPMIGTAHAYLTLGAALFVAFSSRKVEWALYMAAYITGAEVLWRMTDTGVFWEYGKYAVVIVLLASAIHLGRFKASLVPIFYFALLLPSMIFPVEVLSDFHELRSDLSFNLSGPFSLAVAVIYMSQAWVTRKQIHQLLLILIAPILGVLTISSFSTITTRVVWGTESNLAASGGFGPNQVSAALGLGALLAFILLLDARASRPFKFILFALMVSFVVQDALTFSRTGLYLALSGSLIAAFYLVRDGKTRLKLIFFGLLMFGIGRYALLPQLNAFTHGALLNRFENVSLTGRDELVRSDLQIWQDNFFLGVGPGQASHFLRLGRYLAAHTEFSRLLAEHGVLGLIAMFLMGVIAIQNFRKAKTTRDRALVGAFITWSMLYMAVSAMRSVAPSFFLGLSSLNFIRDESDE